MAKRETDITADGQRERQPVVSFWLNEIEAAKKREKDYRKEGVKVLEIYGGEKKETTPFNILFSNTETMLPALYSAVPRPVVTRRFKDADQTGKLAAQAGQRMLEFLLDTNIEGYETFDEGMNSATLDALLPGRGVTCVKYDAEIGELPPAAPSGDANAAPGSTSPQVEPDPYKASELVCIDHRIWNRVFFGYAKKWSNVPWIAFEEHIDQKEAERLFGAAIAGKLVYTENEDQDSKEDKADKEDKNQGAKKTACVYQIWDKTDRRVKYVCAQYNEGLLKEEDDPLELTGFYPIPKPLQFLKKNDLLPKALYELYENQAKELNELTRRISRIAKAIKARGIYAGSLGTDIEKLMEADDNALVPADDESTLAAEKGLQNAIWFMPIDVLITTLTQLLQARESCKQVIYEITGIADIMRGQSSASETLGAQEIKQHWGTLRLRRLQKEVQRYARDMLRMMLEVAATKFSEETWAKMTGLPFVTSQKRAALEQIALAAKMNGQELDQQTAAAMAMPVWGQVLDLLKNDLQRAYRIDIETNSTIEAEATEDKQMISEVMTALGQLLNGVAPLVERGVLPFQAAQAFMLAVVRRFRFGPEVEEYIQAMTEPKPQDDGKGAEAQKAMQDADAKVQQADAKVQAMEAEKKLLERSTALDVREMKLNAEQAVFDMQKDVDKNNQQNQSKLLELKNSKFKTENVVNQKADETLGKGVQAMQTIVTQMGDMLGQLMQVVAQQSAESREQIQTLTTAITAPRRRKAVRGPDGKIAETIEEVAA